MRTTRCGTQSTVQSMSIILGRWHRLLHVWALLEQRNGGEQEICPIHHGLPLDSQFLHIEKGTPRAPLREEARGITSISSRIRSRRNERRDMSWVIHDRFIRDEKFCKNLHDVGRNEEICREVDKMANEDHTHHITQDENRVNRNNWWIRSNIVSSDTMPLRHRADFKQALTTLRQLKNQEDTACAKSGKALLHPCGTGKNLGGIFHLSITATLDPAPIDQCKPDGR